VIARFFVDRPIFATVISVVFVFAGGIAVFTLPVAQYPDVSPPTVQVTAIYPGANSITVRDTIAAPIEEQVSGVEGMVYMTSRCTNDGAYNLSVTFKLGTDSDLAQVLVQNRVSLAQPVIPALVQNEGITVKKMSPNTLMIVNLISPNGRYNDIFLSNYATIFVKDELARLPGVAGLTYLGQRDYSLRAWLDSDKMAALGISAMDVVTAISQQNIQVAAGQIGQQPVPSGQQFQYPINTLGRLNEPDQFANIIIKTSSNTSIAMASTDSSGSSTDSSGGTTGSSSGIASGSGSTAAGTPSSSIVTLRDIARVERGSQQYDQSCTLNGRPSVALSVYQLPGSNALQTASGVYKKMKELKTRFPDGLDYKIVYDTTPFIRQSVFEVFYTLRDAVILVAIVVLVFLQDWKAMILPMIDVPVSLIGTFAIMALLGFTLNNLTLFGLVLAIGIVVDDAIVVLENIERLIATGLDARTATIKAMEEITGPVLAITLVLSSVFIPCCFLGGVSGQFFRQFAVTIAVSTIISAVNALTMTPSRAVVIFKTEEGHGGHIKKEALPWWIFGILGGVVTYWLADTYLTGHLDEYHLLPGGRLEADLPDWAPWALGTAYFIPGMLAGMVIGYIIIRPVNALLGSLFRAFNSLFDVLTAGYGVMVGWSLRLSLMVLLIYGGLLALTYWEFDRTPTGFVPQQDKGYLLLNVQLPDSSSVQRTQAIIQQIDDECRFHYRLPAKEMDWLRSQNVPEEQLVQISGDFDNEKHFLAALAKVMPREKLSADRDDILKRSQRGIKGIGQTVGVSGQSLILNANAPNLGSLYLLLDPFEERGQEESADVLARKIEERCQKKVTGALVKAFGAPPIDGLGTTGGFKLILEDRGNSDMTELQKVSDAIMADAPEVESLQGLFSSSSANAPWLYLDINRTKCLALGVAVSDVFNTLQVYLGSYYVNNFNEFGRTWQVNVQADERFRSRANDIGKLQVRNNQGQMVRLGTVLDVRNSYGPVMIMRYNLYAAAAITGDAAAGVGSSEAVAQMQELAEKHMEGRPTMAFEWTELAFLQLQAGNTAMYFFALAVVFVFLVLAAQYESWKLPMAVILVVPMCLLCSVIGVHLAGLEVTIFTQIGFVVLVGLASKNAILIVEFAKVLYEGGKPRHEATVEACKLRLRPIIMTSFAFILGVVPLVLAHGAGAEMRRSLGTAVFSGMLGVTAFGIFLTPVFFYVIQRFERREPPSGERTTEAHLEVEGLVPQPPHGPGSPSTGLRTEPGHGS
jgi:multidrug efflux pump